MSQETSTLAIAYLQQRNGYPTQYRHDLLDGRLQGVAFLNGLNHKERVALPYKMSSELRQISSPESLEDFINRLLDHYAKEKQNAPQG